MGLSYKAGEISVIHIILLYMLWCEEFNEFKAFVKRLKETGFLSELLKINIVDLSFLQHN